MGDEDQVDGGQAHRPPWRKPSIVVLDVPTRTRGGQFEFFWESIFTDLFRLPS